MDVEKTLAVYYDLVPSYAEREDIDFYCDLAKEIGGSVLEIGCGTGRILIPLVKLGVEIFGIDCNEYMINRCREKLREEKQEIKKEIVFQLDMRSFSFNKKFKLVIMPFRSFQYIRSIDEQIETLKCIYKHMLEGGYLLIDIFNPSLKTLIDETKETVCEESFVGLEGELVHRELTILSTDIFNKLINIDVAYHIQPQKGHKKIINHQLNWRYLFRFEMEHLLHRCGFELIKVWGGYGRETYGTKEPGELICLARKI